MTILSVNFFGMSWIKINFGIVFTDVAKSTLVIFLLIFFYICYIFHFCDEATF